MVGAEGALEIRVLHRHGKGIREIVRDTGISRNTVRRYLRDEVAIRYKPRPPRPAKLDPFKAYVVERLRAAAPERIPASVLLMELRERGYTGGYTMLKMFAASLRPQRAGSAHHPLRDRAGRTDAGGLGGDPARQQPAIGIRGGAGLERSARCARSASTGCSGRRA